MTYKERLKKIDADLQTLIARANALRSSGYTVTINGAYHIDGEGMALVEYSLDNGETWHEVASNNHVVKYVKQIMFKNLDACAELYIADRSWEFDNNFLSPLFTITENTTFVMDYEW